MFRIQNSILFPVRVPDNSTLPRHIILGSFKKIVFTLMCVCIKHSMLEKCFSRLSKIEKCTKQATFSQLYNSVIKSKSSESS